MPPLGSQNDKDKMKASNFPITTFTVGNWKRETIRKGDLTAKIYYCKKKLVWEFLNGPLKSKMEVCWSGIIAIEAAMNHPNQPGFLRVELAKPPLFFREIPPQQRKQTKWEPVDDFTGGQALLCRRHEATFPPGALDKHYEKLLLNDERLARVSRRLFPTNGSFLPLQQIPQQQQLHHSLNANFIAASSSGNGVMGNQINNERTFVDSSRQNLLAVRDQLLHQYNGVVLNNEPTLGNQINNERTFVDSSRQNLLAVRDQRLHQYNGVVLNNEPTLGNQINNERTFVDSSRQNLLAVRDQLLHQYNGVVLNNEPTFVGSSSKNPLNVGGKKLYQHNYMANNNEPTFVGSSSQNPIVVSDDMAAPFIHPPSSCPPKFQHGLIEVEYSDAGEQALADAIVREANATCDAFASSLIELFTVQGQGNEPVGGGNVNEASSTSPAPPTGP
ncbi:uncharacterized protein LOC121795439 [Salvia splendens]|uniref:uncharacterized protein LOC121795439 n=1 Tax=Salvia splendens TaxID=180675 RepID=UPI001C26D7BE|nr:uncharacterized protein LOC121795439 [Salvia splendens]